ncbi:RNA polymerase sigma-70 factor [Chitinophaga pollutisoli]|uniref:RNA polymerase sigma-70 factor n=1 Tax=Chitinophaga pollutisoli TaxID=3133966 RepID=A0ABZ2YQ33_9BACT
MVKFPRHDELSAAIEPLFHQYYPRLCEFAFRYLNDEALAEDVVQDVFVLLCERSGLLPESDTARKNYLYAVVRNACFNRLRHLKVVHRHQDEQLREQPFSPAEVLETIISTEMLSAMHAAVASLPEGCAAVLRKSYVEGLSNTEIAESLKISIHTVKSQKQRALSLLRERLGPGFVFLLFFIR